MIEKFDLNTTYSTSMDGIHWEYHPNKADILEKINELIDAVNAFEPKHGQWIENEGRSGWHCSYCGKDDSYAYTYAENNERELQDFYCPNCGAKMNSTEGVE